MPRRRYIFDPPDQSLLIALLRYDFIERYEWPLNEVLFAKLSGHEVTDESPPTPGNPFPAHRRRQPRDMTAAIDAVNDFTRTEMRGNPYRTIRPPLVISNAELDRVPRRER